MSEYFRINTQQVPQIATSIDLDQMSDLSADQKLRDALSGLYGKSCALVSQLQPGEVQVPSGPLVYEAISIPGYADGTERQPINCQSLILKAVTPMGKLGAWGLDPNGGPEWIVTAPPVVPPVGQPGTGSFMPSGAITATDVYSLLLRNNPTWR